MQAIRIGLSILLLSLGCATEGAVSGQPLHREPTIEEGISSLFPGDAEVLSDEQIRHILESIPALPTPARLALVHLQHQSAARFWGYGPYWAALRPGTRQQLATELGATLSASAAVSAASPLPTFLLPERPSVAHLREAAARYQADAVFIFRSDCQAYERYRLFQTPQAKAFCSVEAALLDIRTGLVPFTSQVLEDFSVRQSRADANMIETVRRAETAALQSALRRVGQSIGAQLAGAR